MYIKAKLAPSTIGLNVVHPSQSVPDNALLLSLAVNITAVGAGPTVTYAFQASLDGGEVLDADSKWFDLMVLPAAADVGVATDTKTAVGAYAYFLALARMTIRKVRLVTTANTNVTYDADLATK